MAIRINLLAEQQAAEDLRRRDPVKRAVYVGALLVAAMVAWIGFLQLQVSAARTEVESYDGKLKRLDETSKQVKVDRTTTTDIEKRLLSLNKYGGERLLWGTSLDAFQGAALDKVRIMDFNATQRYITNDATKFFSTNLVVPYESSRPGWKFWAAATPDRTLPTLVSNQVRQLTNRPPFSTNKLHLTSKVVIASTNTSLKQVVAKVEFMTPPVSIEETVLEIKARDYANPPGSQIDQFTKNLINLPYFKERLSKAEGQALRFTDRPAQARTDGQDATNPNAQFVPFVIECRFQERVLTND